MAVVPGDELRGRMAARQVLTGDAHAAVGLGARRVDDLVIVAAQLGHGDVLAELDAAEEAEARMGGRLVERRSDGLDLLVVGRHARPYEPVRRRQAIEHVHLDDDVVAALQMLGNVEARRAGADDGDAQRLRSGAGCAQRPCSMTIVCSVSTSPWN